MLFKFNGKNIVVKSLLSSALLSIPGSLVFGVYSSVVTRVFFPSALLAPNFANSINATWLAGMIIGAVIGATCVLRSGSEIFRIIAGVLCAWIGFTFFVIQLIFAIVLTYFQFYPAPVGSQVPPYFASMTAWILPSIVIGALLLREAFILFMSLKPGNVQQNLPDS